MPVMHNTTIKTKLTVVIMLTCLIALALTGTAFVVWGQASSRDIMAHNLTTQAGMIADSCKASLSFKDAEDTRQTLSILQAEPSIVYGGVYTGKRTNFVNYYREKVDIRLHPLHIQEQGYHFDEGLLTVFQAIVVDGETIGFVCLRSDLQPLHAMFRRNVSIVTVVLLLALLVAYGVSSGLQGLISRPILKLAEVAQAVSKQKEYSVRAPKQSNDEVGLLIDSFNEMLDQIQQRDVALVQANNDLETQVHARTADLTKEIADRKQSENRANEMASQAQWANAAKSQFLANMSHEIRTPMNAIVGFSELLAEADLAEEQQREVGNIRESAANLLNLINDILDVSKIEAGQLTVEIIECSLGKLLNSLESLMASQAVTKSLEFKIIEGGDLPARIKSDPYRLQQCLINLVNNAIKFTDLGHVHVTVSLQGDQDPSTLRFDIEDTGIGIPKDRQAAVFESFTQADGSTTRKYGGTGLGLTVTKQLTELLGGTLSMTSEPGHGSVFSLVLPVNMDIAGQALLDRRSLIDPEQDTVGHTAAVTFSGKVLLAEDIKTNQVLMTKMLTKTGLEVTLADDGNQALQKALSQSFDLILMDMQMPHMNGYDATRALKQQGCQTPIVALTANAMKGDETKCLAAGCDGYLTKPIDRGELMRIITKTLQPEQDVSERATDSNAIQTPASARSPQRCCPDPSIGSSDNDALDTVINWDRLIERLGDEDIVREIMPSYIEDAGKHVESLAGAVESGDCAAMAYHAHSLKGICRNLSVEQASDIAAQMEHAAKEDDIEAARGLFGGFRVEIDRVLRVLSQCDWLEKAGVDSH